VSPSIREPTFFNRRSSIRTLRQRRVSFTKRVALQVILFLNLSRRCRSVLMLKRRLKKLWLTKTFTQFIRPFQGPLPSPSPSPLNLHSAHYFCGILSKMSVKVRDPEIDLIKSKIDLGESKIDFILFSIPHWPRRI
jgi:hypothetical protein